MINTGNPSRFESVLARDYQKMGLNDYIDKKIVGKKEYIYDNGAIKFFIEPHTKPELYIFTRTDGTQTLISKNKEKIEAASSNRNHRIETIHAGYNL